MPVGGMDVTGVPVGGMDVTGVPGGCDHMLGFGLFLPLTILTTGSFFFWYPHNASNMHFFP